MKSEASALASLRYKRPESHGTPFGFAQETLDPMTQAIDKFGLPVIPPEHDTPLKRALYLLRAASEIEHGLLIQYLYAAYSIDVDALPALKTTWRRPLINIAIQEMGHLLCVQNLTRFLKGGGLYFDRANFPIPPSDMGAYPFPFQFEPLSRDSLSKYVTAESPFPLPKVGLSDDQRGKVEQIWKDAIKAAGDKTLGHVGMLYLALYWLFCPEDKNAGPWPETPTEPFPVSQLAEAKYGHLDPTTNFADPATFTAFQATATEFRGRNGPDDHPEAPSPPDKHRVIWNVTTPDLARKCIYQIAAQGEGVAFAANSHFIEFFNLYGAFTTFSDPGGQKQVRQFFPTNPRVESAEFPDAAKPWGRLFNNRYRMLLLKLPLALSLAPGDGTTPASRDDLPDHLMDEEMKGDGGILGLTNSLIQRKAAPPFELPEDATLFGLPDGRLPVEQAAVKQGLIKLVDEAVGLVDQMLAAGSAAAPTDPEKQALNAIKADDAKLRAVLSHPATLPGGSLPSGT